MGQKLNGSLGSWVTLSDPFPALGLMALSRKLSIKITDFKAIFDGFLPSNTH